MEEIAQNIARAREYAMSNHYETASIVMQNMVQELNQYMRGCQDEKLKARARRLHEACQMEVRIFNDLVRETNPASLEPPIQPRGQNHQPAIARDDMYNNNSNNNGFYEPHDYVVQKKVVPRPAEDEAEWGFEDRRIGVRPGWDPTPGAGWDPNPPIPARRPVPVVSSNADRPGRRQYRADMEPRGRSAGAVNRNGAPVPSSANAGAPRPQRKPDVPKAGAKAQAGAAGGGKKSRLESDEKDLVGMIEAEIVDCGASVTWDSIAGLEEAKSLLQEAVVLPLWMPNLFRGIRRPWSGVLLYGPPGTGKTLLAKAVATECGSTFFSISTATLTSKWRGDSEKLVRILFEMARQRAPSVIFIDEIDALTSQRGGSNEHEASRRVKTELLIQMDGMAAAQEGTAQVMVLGATNHPWDLDDAMRRRLEKRIYIPLPEEKDREALFRINFRGLRVAGDVNFAQLSRMTAGYSCHDITCVCRDASLMKLRQLRKEKTKEELLQLGKAGESDLGIVDMSDLTSAISSTPSSVSAGQIQRYDRWMDEFGTPGGLAGSSLCNMGSISFQELEMWEREAPRMKVIHGGILDASPPLDSQPKQLGKLKRKPDVPKFGDKGEKKKFEAASKDEKELVEMIERDIVCRKIDMPWSKIAGLEEAKALLEEAVVLPLLMPDFFTGIRRPWSGVLMYGPPGTGKTLLAKAVATECNTTFFSVSTATLTSKWRGDSEKLVRILFNMARHYAPSTIFIDEIDSLTTQRGSANEDEPSRRVKTELLTQMDGMANAQEGFQHVMVLGATNHPWDLDDAMRRRLEKRIYIPLPEEKDREALFRINLRDLPIDPDVDFAVLARSTAGYSGHDITCVCRDAAMIKVRRLVKDKSKEELRQLGMRQKIELPINMAEFLTAIRSTPPSVSQTQALRFRKWTEEFGTAAV